MRLPRTALLGAAAFALGACASFAVFAGKDREVRFPHARHAQASVDCVTCHETAYDATSFASGTRHLPEQKICLGCHKPDAEKPVDTSFAREWPEKTFTIRIDHAAHIERTEEDCTVCHKVLPEPNQSARTTPTMASCLGCHEHEKAYQEGRCDQCHESLQRFPLAPVAEFSHQGNFVKQHVAAARASPGACADCHEQNFCAECHASTSPVRPEVLWPERVERNFIHRGDYLSRHSIEATNDAATCERCHAKTTCQECHDAMGVGPGARTPRDPHPPGFAFPGPNSHALAARQDIGSCVACHDRGAQTNCITCHAVGGVGGDPHPAGFASGHPASEVATNGMCLLCHQNGR